MDKYQGLANVIRQAVRDARNEGQDYIGQTGHAIRAFQAVLPDMGAPEAMALVRRVQEHE